MNQQQELIERESLVELEILLGEYSQYFNGKPNAARQSKFAKSLNGIDKDVVKHALEVCLERTNYFPTLKDIREALPANVTRLDKINEAKEANHVRLYDAEESKKNRLAKEFTSIMGKDAFMQYLKLWIGKVIGVSKFYSFDFSAFYKCAIFDLDKADGNIGKAIKIGLATRAYSTVK